MAVPSGVPGDVGERSSIGSRGRLDLAELKLWLPTATRVVVSARQPPSSERRL
jgi:hypothetical protein